MHAFGKQDRGEIQNQMILTAMIAQWKAFGKGTFLNFLLFLF